MMLDFLRLGNFVFHISKATIGGALLRLIAPDHAINCGYMGASEIFDDAIAEFAVEYADQTH